MKLYDQRIGNKTLLQINNTRGVKTQQKKMCYKMLLTIKSSNKKLGNKDQKYQKDNFQESVNQQLSESKKSRWSQRYSFDMQTKRSPKQDLTQRLRSIFLPWKTRVAKIPNKKSCVLKQKR